MSLTEPLRLRKEYGTIEACVAQGNLLHRFKMVKGVFNSGLNSGTVALNEPENEFFDGMQLAICGPQRDFVNSLADPATLEDASGNEIVTLVRAFEDGAGQRFSEFLQAKAARGVVEIQSGQIPVTLSVAHQYLTPRR